MKKSHIKRKIAVEVNEELITTCIEFQYIFNCAWSKILTTLEFDLVCSVCFFLVSYVFVCAPRAFLCDFVLCAHLRAYEGDVGCHPRMHTGYLLGVGVPSRCFNFVRFGVHRVRTCGHTRGTLGVTPGCIGGIRWAFVFLLDVLISYGLGCTVCAPAGIPGGR